MKRLLLIGILCQLLGNAESVLATIELLNGAANGTVSYKNVSASDEVVLYSGEPECTLGSRPRGVNGTGYLNSPNYGLGLNYPNNADCQWRLTALYSTYYVQLMFTSFSTELNNDIVYLFDGYSTLSTILARLSGTATFSFSFPSSQQYMYVQFASDLSVTSSGFSATFTTVSSAYMPCSANPCRNGGTCWNYGTSSYNCECTPGYSGTSCQTLLACSPNPCQNGGTCTPSGSYGYACTCRSGYTGANCQSTSSSSCSSLADYTLSGSGTISSPNYPNNYPSSAQTQWCIQAYNTYGTVSLAFNAIRTESNGDYINIYDGTSTSSSRIASLSGYYKEDSLPSYTSTGKYMTVTFTSDSSINYSGFTATYSAGLDRVNSSSLTQVNTVALVVTAALSLVLSHLMSQ